MLKSRKYSGLLSVPNTIQPSNVPELVNRSFEIPGMVYLVLCTIIANEIILQVNHITSLT